MARIPKIDRPLRVCLLSYRSNPHCGGQGVYVKNLACALTSQGHKVDVVSGPPYPELSPGVTLHKLPGLDLYDSENPFRMPRLLELADPVNLYEWLSVSTMGFPEPLTFGIRAWNFLRRRTHDYDVVHDNQSLSYGVWGISNFLPTVATIHHPITVDRDVAVASVRSWIKKAKIRRWYGFVGMQLRTSRHLLRTITVSEASRRDICQVFPIRPDTVRVVPNGVNTDLFRPSPGVARNLNHVLVTNSADTPLKGLYHLLKAVDQARRTRPDLKLVVIGTPKKDGGILKLVAELSLGDVVEFTGRLSDEAFAQRFASCGMAVVPSLYEGFGLPAAEAMACGVPVISTTGGALPEVVGDAGVLVPPGDPDALAAAILDLAGNPEKAGALGRAGYERVLRLFTWERAARLTTDVYQEAMDAYRPV
ncbi:MAG: glycosyltransferase family 4 protein [Proteobacteria bacterium]|nr:glycosyltransferase family 4 protein [Pseudomonadota bacterium]